MDGSPDRLDDIRAAQEERERLSRLTDRTQERRPTKMFIALVNANASRIQTCSVFPDAETALSH